MFDKSVSDSIVKNLSAHLTPADMAHSPHLAQTRKLADKFSDLNLEAELLMQYREVIDLQTRTFADEDIPANQKAQVAGQVAGILQQLVKMQGELRREETLRLMERVLIDILVELPKGKREEFMKKYEAAAAEAGLS